MIEIISKHFFLYSKKIENWSLFLWISISFKPLHRTQPNKYFDVIYKPGTNSNIFIYIHVYVKYCPLQNLNNW